MLQLPGFAPSFPGRTWEGNKLYASNEGTNGPIDEAQGPGTFLVSTIINMNWSVMMALFWILTLSSLVLVGSVMGFLAYLARDVPDPAERYSGRRRLKPDQLRLLAYALMVAICLLGAMIELAIML